MPTPVIFRIFRRRQMDGTAGDLDAASAVSVMLLTPTASPNTQTHTEITDLSGNEVSGGGYTAGGAAVTTPSLTNDGDYIIWTHDDVSWAQNASGFTNARYAIWYFTTGGDLIAWMDLGASYGNVSGTLTLDVGSTGVMRIE